MKQALLILGLIGILFSCSSPLDKRFNEETVLFSRSPACGTQAGKLTSIMANIFIDHHEPVV